MRVHRLRAEVVLAACDHDLLGRDLKVGDHGRLVNVNPHFYGERIVTEEEFLGVRLLACDGAILADDARLMAARVARRGDATVRVPDDTLPRLYRPIRRLGDVRAAALPQPPRPRMDGTR